MRITPKNLLATATIGLYLFPAIGIADRISATPKTVARASQAREASSVWDRPLIGHGLGEHPKNHYSVEFTDGSRTQLTTSRTEKDPEVGDKYDIGGVLGYRWK